MTEYKAWKMLMMTAFVTSFLMAMSQAIESPLYTTIHTDPEFDVRRYSDSVWMSAPVTHPSFHQATKLGFHRLFQYIEGANLNYSRIPMTKPVLTSIVPEVGILHSSPYVVHFYLPQKFHSSPPLPLPELKLKPVSWSGRCIAVRTFSGFARDGNVIREAKKLAASLAKSPWANSTSADSMNAYSIAQYDSPLKLIGRTNEVWVDVDGSEANNCGSSGTATYK